MIKSKNEKKYANCLKRHRVQDYFVYQDMCFINDP